MMKYIMYNYACTFNLRGEVYMCVCIPYVNTSEWLLHVCTHVCNNVCTTYVNCITLKNDFFKNMYIVYM